MIAEFFVHHDSFLIEYIKNLEYLYRVKISLFGI
jgi:hypothetical protein